MNTLGKYKTYVEAKAVPVEPGTDQFKAVAAAAERYGLEIKPQMDLLYVESCLVSAGLQAGINDNDDIFTREEAWAARHTPVLKPLNWQHVDKDIVGVMYSVQARDLDGNILDFNDDTPPDVDFDLYTEAVVFRMIHEDRANEVEARVKAGDLFVSMEAWFDDYQYGFCDSGGQLTEIVERNKSTAFLDNHLRAFKGSGSYDGKKVGRVLGSITFGGCGLVDRPANKRSFITDVRPLDAEPVVAESEREQLDRLVKLLSAENVNIVVSNQPIETEEVFMNAQANSNDKPLTKAEIAELLDERERLQAQAAEQEALQAKASELEDRTGELEQEVSTLNEAVESKDAEVKALNEQFDALNEALDELVTEQAEAGATDSTPAEIAKIDNAGDSGDSVWQAKLAWLKQSRAALVAKAARAEKLEQELAEAAQAVREQEVRAMFAGILPEDTVDALVAKAKSLDEDGYVEWRTEKELLAIDMASAQMPPEMKKKLEEKKNGKNGKKEEGKDAKADATEFRNLLEQRLAEGKEGLINHPGGEDIKSGVNPGTLRSQRHKIAGSAAGDDLVDELDNAQVDDDVNLAGASQADGDGEGGNPFAALAAIITGNDEDEKEVEGDEAPDFDPVK